MLGQRLWALCPFLFLLLNTWVFCRWSTREPWIFNLRLFVLFRPILGCILAVLPSPDPFPEGPDLQTHYDRSSHWFFGLAARLPLIDAVDTALKGTEHFAAPGTIYPLMIVLRSAPNAAASATHNPRSHPFFAVFFPVHSLGFIAVRLRQLA